MKLFFNADFSRYAFGILWDSQSCFVQNFVQFPVNKKLFQLLQPLKSYCYFSPNRRNSFVRLGPEHVL